MLPTFKEVVEKLFADGLVKVNSEVAQVGQSIRSGDRVELDGKAFVASALTEPARVLVYNKPEGEVTTREDPEGRDARLLSPAPPAPLHRPRWPGPVGARCPQGGPRRTGPRAPRP